MNLVPELTIKYMDIYLIHFSASYYSNYCRQKANSSVNSHRKKRGGGFGDLENQLFLRNRGLFNVKVSEKGGIFLT